MINSISTAKDFHCRMNNGTYSFDADAPRIKGGSGNGLRPHELLEAALASCINITIRMIAKEKNIRLESVRTQVDLIRSDICTTFKYKIILDSNLPQEISEFFKNVLDLCAVRQTLSKELKFEQTDD